MPAPERKLSLAHSRATLQSDRMACSSTITFSVANFTSVAYNKTPARDTKLSLLICDVIFSRNRVLRNAPGISIVDVSFKVSGADNLNILG